MTYYQPDQDWAERQERLERNRDMIKKHKEKVGFGQDSNDWKFDKVNGSPAPREQLRNRLELLEDIRCWLLDRIDGSEETKGDDGLISDFIRKLDALSSDMGTIPDAERKKVMDAHLAATVEPRGCPTPGACSAVEELADLKQRLLPQFQGRAERAEHERDALLEKLIAAQKVISGMTAGVSEWAQAWRDHK